MKYRHWSGWIILLTVLAGIAGCSRAGQDRKGRNLGVYEAFMQEMEDSLTKRSCRNIQQAGQCTGLGRTA